MKSYLLAFLSFISLLCPDAVSQPSNDECSTAKVLVQTSYCNPITATTENATQSMPPLVCSGLVGYSDDDVWFIFEATTSHVTIEVDGLPGFDTVVDFRESPCNGTPIACVDATGSGGTELISKTGLYIGNIYLIRVYSYGYGATAQGTFTICAYGAPPYPPVNDYCSAALWLLENPDCQMFTATTVSASQSTAPIVCNGNIGFADDDVWFIFKATTENPVVKVTGTPLFDPVVDLRTGNCIGTTLFCSDSTGAGGTEIIEASGLTLDENYHIRIYGYGNGPNDEGEFDICVSEASMTGNASFKGSRNQVALTPNPFSDACRITFTLKEKSRVTIRIFSLLGQEIASLMDEDKGPGTHKVEWRPGQETEKGAISLYYCRVTLGPDQVIKKIIHLPQ